jgi:hypothetical protein
MLPIDTCVPAMCVQVHMKLHGIIPKLRFLTLSLLFTVVGLVLIWGTANGAQQRTQTRTRWISPLLPVVLAIHCSQTASHNETDLKQRQ